MFPFTPTGTAPIVILEEPGVDEVEDAAKVILERPVHLDRLHDEVLLGVGLVGRPRNLKLEIGLLAVSAALLLFRFWGTGIDQRVTRGYSRCLR